MRDKLEKIVSSAKFHGVGLLFVGGTIVEAICCYQLNKQHPLFSDYDEIMGPVNSMGIVLAGCATLIGVGACGLYVSELIERRRKSSKKKYNSN